MPDLVLELVPDLVLGLVQVQVLELELVPGLVLVLVLVLVQVQVQVQGARLGMVQRGYALQWLLAKNAGQSQRTTPCCSHPWIVWAFTWTWLRARRRVPRPHRPLVPKRCLACGR